MFCAGCSGSVCVARSRPRWQCRSPTGYIASLTGIASPDDWQGARTFACAGHVAFNTPVAVYGNKRSNSGRSESAADRPSRSRSARQPVTVAGEWSSKRDAPCHWRNRRSRAAHALLSRAKIFACETALALARSPTSPALLVRHLFSGERASLRPEVQIVVHGLDPRHAVRHGKRLLNLYLRIHVS
jgi:hypothetical protein